MFVKIMFLTRLLGRESLSYHFELTVELYPENRVGKTSTIKGTIPSLVGF